MDSNPKNRRKHQDSQTEVSRGAFDGGRLARLAGEVISIAPAKLFGRTALMSVSSLALGSVVASSLVGGQGFAQCTVSNETNDSATFVCSGSIDNSLDINFNSPLLTVTGSVVRHLRLELTSDARISVPHSRSGQGAIRLKGRKSGNTGTRSITLVQAPGGQDISVTGSSVDFSKNIVQVNQYNTASDAHINIHLTGNITGSGRVTGIHVANKDGASYQIGSADVTITAADIIISGRGNQRSFGVEVIEVGGDVSVDVGDVRVGQVGIRVDTDSATGTVSVNAGNVLAHDGRAVAIANAGGNFTGNFGDVTSGSSAISVQDSSSTASSPRSVQITTKNVQSVNGGILINHSGAGGDSINITANGNVRATGNQTYLNRVAVGSHGIRVAARSGTITITVNGDVIGGSGSGNTAIFTQISGLTTISVNDGVIDAADKGITTNNGSSKITLNNVTLNSNVVTGSGLDEITIAGNTTFSAGKSIDAGEDANETSASANTAKDLFSVANMNLTYAAADFTSKFKNFERIGAKEGGVITVTGTTTINWDEVVLDKGTLSTQDGSETGGGANDALTVSGNVTTGGNLAVDVDFSTGTTDTITISGNLTGTHKLRVADVTPANAATRVAGPINVVTVTGTTQASALSLGNDELISGNRAYSLSYDTSSKTFRLTGEVLAAPQCTEDTNTAGTFVCAGTISGTQWIITTGTTNNVVTLDDAASVSVTSSWAFRVMSQAGITFTHETGGAPINATGTAPGVIKAETSGSGNVAVTFVNSITQTSSGTTVFVKSTGTGNVGLSVTDVTATNASATAIHVEGAGGDVSVSANSVNGGMAAIIAKNMSSGGSVSVNTSGDVSSTGGDSIYAYSKGASITVNTSGAIRGGQSGIIASNEGSGDGSVSIQTSGAINGNNKDGIFAYNTANGDLTVTANGTVNGKRYGIDARNYNSGNVLITTTAQITGGSGTGKDGISALNDGVGGVTIVAGNVTGDDDGIDVRNKAGGSVEVTANGDIRGRGTGSFASAIFVSSDSDGENVTVSVAEGGGATGGYGIYVENLGSGSVSITASGNVVGTVHEGVYVDNRGTTTNVEVKSVQGSGHGVDVRHEGSGTAEIIVVSGGVIRGREKGIKVVAESDANVSITASGTVTGTGEQGVYARLTGSGNLSITTNAAITGGKEGVDARLDGEGDLSINVAAVTGGEEGIKARKFEDGDLEIIATGAVAAGDGSGDDGVYAYADGVGDISVTVTSVTGDDDGLDLRHYGSGTLTASVTGKVIGNGSGDTDGGISAQGESDAGTMTFDLADTSEVEGYYGLLISREGNGSVVVNASGSIEGKTSDGMDIDVDDGASITINVAGNVTGAAGKVAIDTYTETGSTTIIINSGTITAPNVAPPPAPTPPPGSPPPPPPPPPGPPPAVDPSSLGTAIRNNGGDSSVTVNSGATIGAGITLGGGADALTFVGGTPSSSIMLDGGTDTGNTQPVDKLHFNDVTATLDANKWKNWEEVSIGSDSNISFVGGHNLATRELKLAGILSLQNDKIGEEFLLSAGNLTGDGVIAIDVDFSNGNTDYVNIAGNMTGDFTLRVEDVSPSGTTTRVSHDPANVSPGTVILDKPIIVASVAGTVAVDALKLEHSLVISRGYEYRLSYSSEEKAFVLTGKLGEFVCTESVTVEGQFSCSGAVVVTENLVKSRDTAVVANLPSATTVNVTKGVAFNIGGGGPITFVQDAGGASLNATGTATGVIVARTIGNGNVSVTLTGDVSLEGSGDAILVDSKGSGEVALTTGKVTANNASGTAINVTGSGETITISAGDVSAGSTGIVAKNNNASGAITVNARGTIASSQGDAIYAYGKGTSVTVNTTSAGTASGMVVKAMNKGDGAVVVNTTADVTSSVGKAIYAYGLGTAVTVTTEGLVNASSTAIEARSKGTGTVLIDANDDVTSSDGIAIHAYGQGTSVTVSTSADVTGRTFGIKAENQGSGEGSVAINAAGAVTANAGIGIEGQISSSGTLSISSEVVTGTTTGIVARGTDYGNIVITASGDVDSLVSTSPLQVGIDTFTTSGTTSVTVESGIVKGTTSIRNNDGDSTVTIKSGATLVGDVSLGGGADVVNLDGGTFSGVTFDGGSDAGTDDSVDAINFNAGTTLLSSVDFTNFERIGVGSRARIRFDGNHTQTIGEISLSRGAIGLQDRAVGDNLVITGNLSSESDANYGIIEVDVNFSSGTTDTVSVSGNLSGKYVIKIADVTPSALTTRTSNPITVLTVAGSADKDAVRVDDEKFSSGGYTYTISFDETRKKYNLVGERGTLNCELASDEINFNCTGTIEFTENVTGVDDKDVTVTLDSLATVSVDAGVAFRLTGTGNVTFTQERGGSDLIASGAATGVLEVTTSGNNNISVTVTGKASLTNVGTAIHAVSTGTGNVTVNAREVSAGHGSATAIRAEGQGSSVSVTTGAVNAGQSGIIVRNTGTTGSANLTATGNVTSSGTPIDAYSRSGSVVVNVAGVVGGTNTIVARNNGGSGSIAVTSTGTISGNGVAILAENRGAGSVSIIASSPVQGNGDQAINVTNSEAGAGLSITAAGAEGRRNAIRAVNASDGRVNISLNGRVIGTRSSAIHAENSGTGSLDVAVAGAVQGGAGGAGIDTITSGGPTNITLARGAVVSAGSGIAIRNDEGNSSLVVNRGATLAGTAQLGGGVDTVVLAGGSIGTSILDGGEDAAAIDTSVDVLTINGGSVTLRTNQFVNWERFVLGTSGELRARGEVALRTENISIKGNLTLRDGGADDALTLNGDVDGGGTIHLDADFFVGNSDVVNITGNVTGTTSIVMHDVSTSVGGEDQVPLAIVNVTGTVSESAFTLVNAASNSGPNRYELTFDSNSKSFLLTKKESVGSLMLVAAPVTLFDSFARAPSLHQRHADQRVNNSWVRMIGVGRDYGDAAGEKAEYESDTTGIQMGYDLTRNSGPSGLWIFGMTAQFNELRTDVAAVASEGALKAKGYGIGATATWYGDDGGYIDLQTQINLVNSVFRTSNLGYLMDGVDSTALLLSFETGRSIEVSEHLTATPSVQLSWGRMGTVDFKTSLRQDVHFGNDGGLTGRIGLGIKYSEDDYSLHFLGNLYYDTMDSWDVNFGDKNYRDSKSAISGEFGIGGSMAVTETSTAYIRAEYQTSFGEGFEHRKATKLSAGMRWSW